MPTPTASDYIALKRSLAVTNDSNANPRRKNSFANTQYNSIPLAITSLKYLPYINKTNIVAAQQLNDNVIRMYVDTNYVFSYTYYDFNGNGDMLNVSPKPYMFIIPSDGQYIFNYDMILPSNFSGQPPTVPSSAIVKVLSTTKPSTFMNDTGTTFNNHGGFALTHTAPNAVGSQIMMANGTIDTEFTQGQILFFMPFAYEQNVDPNPNFNNFRISINKYTPPQTQSYSFKNNYQIDGNWYGKVGPAFSFTAQKTGTYNFVLQNLNEITQEEANSIYFMVVPSTITSSTIAAFSDNANSNGITIPTYNVSKPAKLTAGQTIYFLPTSNQIDVNIILNINFHH